MLILVLPRASLSFHKYHGGYSIPPPSLEIGPFVAAQLALEFTICESRIQMLQTEAGLLLVLHKSCYLHFSRDL